MPPKLILPIAAGAAVLLALVGLVVKRRRDRAPRPIAVTPEMRRDEVRAHYGRNGRDRDYDSRGWGMTQKAPFMSPAASDKDGAEEG